MYRADGRTNGWTDKRADMTKLTVTLRNFVKSPKNSHFNGQPKRNGKKKRDHLQLLTCHLHGSAVCINDGVTYSGFISKREVSTADKKQTYILQPQYNIVFISEGTKNDVN